MKALLLGALALLSAILVAGASAQSVPTIWVCSTPVDVDLVRVSTTTDVAVMLQPGCSGRIGRIEITTMHDGIRSQNSKANVVRDLVIESGFIRCGFAPAGTHQDGIQMMAGTNVVFRNIEITGCRTGMLRIVKAGGGKSTPTDVLCEGCYLGPGSAHTAIIGASVRSGLRNSVACPDTTRRNGAIEILSAAQAPVSIGNTQPGAC